MEWPGLDNDPNPDLRDALTNVTYNPDGPAFPEDIPPALLRRGAKDVMAGDVNATQNNRFYAASGRTWSSIAAGDQNRGGWIYITAGTYTGEVFVNASVPDTFGVIYSTYLCW